MLHKTTRKIVVYRRPQKRSSIKMYQEKSKVESLYKLSLSMYEIHSKRFNSTEDVSFDFR